MCPTAGFELGSGRSFDILESFYRVSGSNLRVKPPIVSVSSRIKRMTRNGVKANGIKGNVCSTETYSKRPGRVLWPTETVDERKAGIKGKKKALDLCRFRAYGSLYNAFEA